MPHLPILLAEDNDGDALLVEQAFQKLKVVNPLVRLRDGQELINYLTGMGVDTAEQVSLPGMLLLDLNMPLIGGFETLVWIRRRRVLNRLIVVVLSRSNDPRDILKAYDLHANGYVVKPDSPEKLEGLVQSLHSYWFCWNENPMNTRLDGQFLDRSAAERNGKEQ